MFAVFIPSSYCNGETSVYIFCFCPVLNLNIKMSTKIKCGAEKRRIKERAMLIQAGSDPKQKKLSFIKEEVIVSSESEVRLINYNM